MEGTKRSSRAAFGDAVEGGNANKVHKYDDSSDEDPDRQSSDDSGSDSNYSRFSKSFGTSASSSGSSASSDSSEGSSSSGSAASSSASDSDTSEEGWSTPQLASDAEDADAEDDLDVLIFLDFDDTLFPTTATNFPRKLYSQQGIDEDTQSEVARVEKHSIKFLHAVNDLGTVIIVTNASLRWVEDAIEYMPDMRSLLDQYGIEVVSARDDCKRTNPFMYYYNLISPTGWKRRTFCAEVRKYLEANDYEDCDPDPDDFRVLCVGDSEQETSAALQLEFYNPCVDKDCLRILKLEEHPGIGTMCHQLFHLARCAEKFVKEEEFQEVRLVIYQNC